MLKKTIVYKNFDNEDVIEDFYFNLNKAELLELELIAGGKEGMSAAFKTMVENEDREKIIEAVKLILAKSVGRKSEDGKRFIKNETIRDDFMQSDAYSELFSELVLGGEAKVAEFMNAVIPYIPDPNAMKQIASK